jgi:hypothetical protein
MKTLHSMLLLFFLLFSGIALAQDDSHDDPMKGPWQRPEAGDSLQRPGAKPIHVPMLLVEWYREYISPIDGSDCPMVPSCSQYSMESLEKHGLFMGWVMTWDRLFRCGHEEIKLSPRIIVKGQEKCYDPVKSNDFWWSRSRDDG